MDIRNFFNVLLGKNMKSTHFIEFRANCLLYLGGNVASMRSIFIESHAKPQAYASLM